MISREHHTRNESQEDGIETREQSFEDDHPSVAFKGDDVAEFEEPPRSLIRSPPDGHTIRMALEPPTRQP